MTEELADAIAYSIGAVVLATGFLALHSLGLTEKHPEPGACPAVYSFENLVGRQDCKSWDCMVGSL